MADNSIRERIILANIELLKSISKINSESVIRNVPTLNDLENYSLMQLPVVSVVGKLPEPQNHFSSRDGQVDYIISSLSIDVYVFFQENEEIDQKISYLLDEFWVKLYSDPTRGSLVHATWITCNPVPEYLPPYSAFQLTINHKYKHTTGGI